MEINIVKRKEKESRIMDALEDELDRMCLIPIQRLLYESKSSGFGNFSHDVSYQASPSKTEETNNNDDLTSLSLHEEGKFKEADEAEDESPVPAWMIPDDLTLSSDDEEEDNEDQDTVRSYSLDRYLQDDDAGVDNTEANKLNDESFLDKLNNGDMKNDEPAERKDVEESQTIVRNFVLNQKQSVDTELMMAEKLYEVDADYLATVVCAMLNSKQGGTIFIGVKTNGVIRGIKLDRHKRDKVDWSTLCQNPRQN